MPDVFAGLVHVDPAKAYVMKFISQLVANGFAIWEPRDEGEIELRFNTGETFILADRFIIRVA